MVQLQLYLKNYHLKHLQQQQHTHTHTERNIYITYAKYWHFSIFTKTHSGAALASIVYIYIHTYTVLPVLYVHTAHRMEIVCNNTNV